MELLVQRIYQQKNDTISNFFINGKPNHNILELAIGEGDNLGMPNYAILAGRYKVELRVSPHFPGFPDGIPHLLDVPNREYILIHPGNSHIDTRGCLITGVYMKEDWVGQSQSSFAVLLDILYRADARSEDIWITITEDKMIKK